MHLISAANRKELVDLGGVHILIRFLGSASENEELDQAIKYVLQTCTNTGLVEFTFTTPLLKSALSHSQIKTG